MKKIIKLAAAFAVFGAMLATVGCQQIYEDIDDINAELEEIQGTDLAMLRSEVQNCIADITRVEKAYKAADDVLKKELEDAYQKGNTELMNAATDLLTKTKSEFEGKLSDLQKELETKAKQLVDALSKEIGADELRSEDAKLAQKLKAAVEKLDSVDTALNDSINAHANRIVKLNEDAIKIAQDLADLQTLVDDEISDIEAKVKSDSIAAFNAINDLKEEYLLALAGITGSNDSVAQVITNLREDYIAKLTKLASADTALAQNIADLKDEFTGELSTLQNTFTEESKKLHAQDSVILHSIDTLSVGVNSRISSVQAALCQQIKSALDSAVKYTDEKIAALDIDQKFADMNKALVDSCAVLKEAILAAKAGFELDKYQEIDAAIKGLQNRIQSIVSLPSTEYELRSFSIGGKLFGSLQIEAAFDIKPASAAAIIDKNNVKLHIKKGLYRDVYVNSVAGRVEAKDTMLTGEAITVKVDGGRVEVKAVVPATVVTEGPDGHADRLATWYSLEVTGEATASFANLQSEYVPATCKDVNLNETFKWYKADSAKNNTVSYSDVVCYKSEPKQLGEALSVKAASDYFIGNAIQTITELSALSGDSLYVHFKVDTIVNRNVTHTWNSKIVADSTADATTKYVVTPPTNPGDTLKLKVTPVIMSKDNIELALNELTWTAERIFDYIELGTETYTVANKWEFANASAHEDSVKIVIDTTKSSYKAEELAAGVEAHDVRGLTASNNAIDITRYTYVEDSLYIHYKTTYYTSAKADTIEYKIYPGDTARVIAKIIINTEAMPTVTARIDTTITPNVSYKDTLEFAFTNISHSVINDSILWKDLSSAGLNNQTFTAIGKDSLEVAAGALDFGKEYKDTITVTCSNASHAPYEYVYIYDVKTTPLPFELVRKDDNTAPIMQSGRYKHINAPDSLYQVDSIDIAEYYQVVYTDTDSLYHCPEEEIIRVAVRYGNKVDTVAVTNGELASHYIPWNQNDTTLTTKAAIVYGADNAMKNDTRDSVCVDFKTPAPIISVSIKDSTITHIDGLKDTIEFCKANELIEIVDSANVWDNLKWATETNGDLVGTLESIENTTVTFKVSTRKVYLNNVEVPVRLDDFSFTLVGGKPVFIISNQLSTSNYVVKVDYEVKHLYDNNATDHNGTLTLKINPAQ